MVIAAIEVPLIQTVLPLRAHSPSPFPECVHRRFSGFPDSQVLYMHKQARGSPELHASEVKKRVNYLFQWILSRSKGKR